MLINAKISFCLLESNQATPSKNPDVITVTRWINKNSLQQNIIFMSQEYNDKCLCLRQTNTLLESVQ